MKLTLHILPALLLALGVTSCSLFRPKTLDVLTTYDKPDSQGVRTVELRTVLGHDVIAFGSARVRIDQVHYNSPDTLTGLDDTMRIDVWAPAPAAMRPNRAVVLVHGLGAGIESEYSLALALVRRGYPCILMSHRGANANSSVRPTYGIREVDDVTDALNAFADWSRQAPEELRVGAFGTSLGGVICIDAASRDPRIVTVATEGVMWNLERAGLQLMGQASLEQMVAGAGVADAPAAFRALSPSATVPHFPRIPLIAVWGADDNVVPPDERRTLADSARGHALRLETAEIPKGVHTMRYGFPLSEKDANALNERIAEFLAGALAD